MQCTQRKVKTLSAARCFQCWKRLVTSMASCCLKTGWIFSESPVSVVQRNCLALFSSRLHTFAKAETRSSKLPFQTRIYSFQGFKTVALFGTTTTWVIYIQHHLLLLVLKILYDGNYNKKYLLFHTFKDSYHRKKWLVSSVMGKEPLPARKIGFCIVLQGRTSGSQRHCEGNYIHLWREKQTWWHEVFNYEYSRKPNEPHSLVSSTFAEQKSAFPSVARSSAGPFRRQANWVRKLDFKWRSCSVLASLSTHN